MSFQEFELDYISLNKRKKFTPEEDEELKKLVALNGARKWKSIASHIPGRTGRQCRDRYIHYLQPGFKTDEWTPGEDTLLIEKFKQYGNKWSTIARFFKGRSGSTLKNRYNAITSVKSEHVNEKKREEVAPVEVSKPKTESIVKEAPNPPPTSKVDFNIIDEIKMRYLEEVDFNVFSI